MMVSPVPDLTCSWAKSMKQHWTNVRPYGPWDRPSGAAASKAKAMVTPAVRIAAWEVGAGLLMKSTQVLLNKEMDIRVLGGW